MGVIHDGRASSDRNRARRGGGGSGALAARNDRAFAGCTGDTLARCTGDALARRTDNACARCCLDASRRHGRPDAACGALIPTNIRAVAVSTRVVVAKAVRAKHGRALPILRHELRPVRNKARIFKRQTPLAVGRGGLWLERNGGARPVATVNKDNLAVDHPELGVLKVQVAAALVDVDARRSELCLVGRGGRISARPVSRHDDGLIEPGRVRLHADEPVGQVVDGELVHFRMKRLVGCRPPVCNERVRVVRVEEGGDLHIVERKDWRRSVRIVHGRRVGGADAGRCRDGVIPIRPVKLERRCKVRGNLLALDNDARLAVLAD
ncbi:hypothetical protein CAOG_009889 [Capsaspora owczarzaki ATCC 30864]|uniref:Uncharacterized protein n=1 Tax=Capsaspora owczarzaki (strain ATCC 30864) TaxID=595528 RepID=A0A0D2UJF1_CAPO3|nr:hypothetical protein CAOG_009889 [Capsaspora owczarzaki ATCC 30864]